MCQSKYACFAIPRHLAVPDPIFFFTLAPHRDPLKVSINLGPNKFFFDEDDCEWGSKSNNLFAEDEAEITKLQTEIKRMLNEIKIAEDEKLEAIKAKCSLEFENKLLTEMVAVAQLDWKKNTKDLENEQLKTEALKWEMANLALAKQEEEEDEEEDDDDDESNSDEDGEDEVEDSDTSR